MPRASLAAADEEEEEGDIAAQWWCLRQRVPPWASVALPPLPEWPGCGPRVKAYRRGEDTERSTGNRQSIDFKKRKRGKEKKKSIDWFIECYFDGWMDGWMDSSQGVMYALQC